MTSEEQLLVINEVSKINGSIERLNEKVDGINRRLDISNGRIAKNEEHLNEQDKGRLILQNQIENLQKTSKSYDDQKREIRTEFHVWRDRFITFVLYMVGILAFKVLEDLKIVNLS